jgi:hypothetical protein
VLSLNISSSSPFSAAYSGGLVGHNNVSTVTVGAVDNFAVNQLQPRNHSAQM